MRVARHAPIPLSPAPPAAMTPTPSSPPSDHGRSRGGVRLRGVRSRFPLARFLLAGCLVLLPGIPGTGARPGTAQSGGTDAGATGVAVDPEASPAAARIWGRVRTGDGEVREGFLRWDRNELQWDDLLDGTRRPTPARIRLLADVIARATEPRRRVVELAGYRISWDEPDPALAARRQAAIRFGLLASLQRFEEGSVLLTLTSGEVQEFDASTSDLGVGFRGLIVEGTDGARDSLSWEAVDRVDFAAAPDGAVPGERRLSGTVHDRWGGSWSGWIAWDGDEALPSDILDGRESGTERRIPFAGIRELARDGSGTRVTERDGAVRTLTGSNDVSRGNRGVRVTDPALGSILVPWSAFERLRFHDDAVPGSRRDELPWPLAGEVVTRGGDRLSGTILWDGDEGWSWEHLDGEWRELGFQVEFRHVDRIVRRSAEEAEVRLRDGRVLTLSGSNDVSEDNRGILVRPGGEGEWILVSWDELEEVRFEHPEG